MPSPLPFTAPWLLAPMEGVTEPAFRELVARLHGPGHLGGVFTEFVRVVEHPVHVSRLKRHLGDGRHGVPVGLQLMGSDEGACAASAANAEQAGAALVDLNFGCPAKGALKGCAGSALLAEPAAVERLVAACVTAVRSVPVTAKIRAGVEDANLLQDVARAVQEGGASLLTVHARTRREAFAHPVDWSRITRACECVDIPVCGNGGVREHADLERMRRETGCAFVMVGHAALGDPWIFSGERVAAGRALGFLVDYAAALEERGFSKRARAGRVKQLLHHWSAGGVFADEKRAWLREREPARFLDVLQKSAAISGSSTR